MENKGLLDVTDSFENITTENLSDSEDDELLDDILDEIPDVGKDKDGALDEVPLFNITTGKYIGARIL